MAIVAGGFSWGGREFAAEFWKLAWSRSEPNVFGLALTGVITLVWYAWTLALSLMAYLVLFRSRPERFVFEGSRLLYEPGSALAAFGPGDPYDRMVLWNMLRGRTQLKLSKSEFGGAATAEMPGKGRRRRYVQIKAGTRCWRAGQFLDLNEQRWLAETLEEWGRR